MDEHQVTLGSRYPFITPTPKRALDDYSLEGVTVTLFYHGKHNAHLLREVSALLRCRPIVMMPRWKATQPFGL